MLILVPGSVPSARAAEIPGPSSVTAQFTKTSSDEGEAENRGVLYFSAQGWWRIDSVAPLEQCVVSTDTLTTILYPDREMGFFVHTPLLVPPSMILFLLVGLRTNEQLLESGMHVVGFETSADSTITSWRPSSALAKDYPGMLTLTRHRGDLVRLQMRDASGHSLTYHVEEQTDWNGLVLPSRLRLERWEDGRDIVEIIRYWDFAAGPDGQADSYHPIVPDSYEMEERTW